MKMYRSHEVDLNAVVATHDRWWKGELGRPLFVVSSQDSGFSLPGCYHFMPGYPAGTSAAEIVDHRFRQVAATSFLADGFPFFWINFGPGVVAAMTGGTGHATPETVWFEPGKFAGCELEDIRIKFDPESEWAIRIADVCREAAARVTAEPIIVGMTDLGGTCDILASLRGSDKLLFDLLDSPEEVKRLLAEETAAFQDTYTFFHSILGPAQPGTSCWAALLSSGRNYMLQSDFSYMISPDMFAEFVKPELEKQCRWLDHGFYHLDGKGQIGHLPHLFAIPGMAGIQWIPGDGQPPQSEWPEVIRQIDEAGKKLQLLGSLDSIESCLKQLKHPENALVLTHVSQQDLPRIEKLINDYS